MNFKSSLIHPRRRFLAWMVIALILVAIYFRVSRKSQPPINAEVSVTTVHSNALQSSTAATNPVSDGNTNMATVKQSPALRFSLSAPHFFRAALTNGSYEWTAEDGMDTNVIRKLAHNDFEYKRMVDENSAIHQRQLVYVTESLAAVFEQAEVTGKPMQQLTLPGLNGQLLSVAVTRADLKDGGDQGQVYGQLPGQPDSMVTVAFVGSREAFTLISPRDNIYLQAESHDPGEVIVKSIDPNTYGIPKR